MEESKDLKFKCHFLLYCRCCYDNITGNGNYQVEKNWPKRNYDLCKASEASEASAHLGHVHTGGVQAVNNLIERGRSYPQL